MGADLRPPARSAMNTAARMTDAARAWLDGLDPDQRERAVRPWPSDEERTRWFYTPTDHGGLPLAGMRPAQQGRAMQLVATGLSTAGYVTVATIMGLENVLDQLEGWTRDWGRDRGRDPQLYWLQVFGEPSRSGPWSWRFGGHHVSLHLLVVDDDVAATTPCFLGADPATAPLLGPHPLRPLGGAEDLARELVHSLDRAQLARALLGPVAPFDIVSGNRPRLHDGDEPIPLPALWRAPFVEDRLVRAAEEVQRSAEEGTGWTTAHGPTVRYTERSRGLAGAHLTPGQQEQLRAVLQVYLHRIPDELAEREAARFAGEKLAQLHLAWAGGLDAGQPHYYRIQGPQLLIEYDNTQRGANHAHSVWRNPDNDFGHDVLAEHLRTHHGRSPR